MRKKSVFLKKNEQGSMVLALAVTLTVITVSLMVITVLAFQLDKQNATTSEWETDTALTSGIAFAAEQIGSAPLAQVNTVAGCQNFFPQQPPQEGQPGYTASWLKNTATATSGNVTLTDIEKSGGRSELGLFRWWASCDRAEDGYITGVVQASNLMYGTRTVTSLKTSLINSDTWTNYPAGQINTTPVTTVAGGATGTSFSIYGVNAANFFVDDMGPFGPARLWGQQDGGVSSQDGGWVSTSPGISVDKTATYRFSVWVKRTAVPRAGSGLFYFGPNTGSAVYEGKLDPVTGEQVPGLQGNPYFVVSSSNGSPLTTDWVLAVFYVYPQNTLVVSTNVLNPDQTGLFTKTGTKINTTTVMKDFAWGPTSTTTGLRAFLVSSSLNTPQQYLYNPRIDKIDGTEPSFEELFREPTNSIPVLVEKNVVFKNGKLAYITSGD